MQHSAYIMDIEIYVIGHNGSGELNIKNSNKNVNENKLTKCKHNMSLINTIKSGSQYTIYANYETQAFYAAGSNEYGQLGIDSNATIVTSCRMIRYFMNTEIYVVSICANHVSKTTFWISDTYKAYGNGYNKYYQLGIGNNKNQSIPVLVKGLCNPVLDIQCANTYSIALCDMTAIIVNVLYFTSIESKHTHLDYVPIDITSIIILYLGHRVTAVYSCGYSEYNGHGHKIKQVKQWTLIQSNFKNIIQIATGNEHSLFLDATGVIYSCGNNENGELGRFGLSESGRDRVIKSDVVDQIDWLSDHKIINIKCGNKHNLAMDEKGEIYSWGFNKNGECGHKRKWTDTGGYIQLPQVINAFEDKKVIDIVCGAYHSYAKTDDGNHYLWGLDRYNECITYDTYNNGNPTNFIHILKTETRHNYIEQVSLGNYNTKLITKLY